MRRVRKHEAACLCVARKQVPGPPRSFPRGTAHVIPRRLQCGRKGRDVKASNNPYSDLPEMGLPYFPPATVALEDILLSGDLRSRGVLLVCEDITRADTLALALARAWLCDSHPLGCGGCFDCRGEYFGRAPLVRISSKTTDAPQLAEATAPFGERDVWCAVIHDASLMTLDAAGFLVAALADGCIEPGGLVVLTSRSVEAVPEPVRSRCVRFDIRDGVPAPVVCEWTDERMRTEEYEALGLCLSGDVFGSHRAALDGLALRPVGELIAAWEQAIESSRVDYGRKHLVAGIIMRADGACERACGYLKLKTLDHGELAVLQAGTLPEEQRRLLRVGSCVALRVSFAPGLDRWWGAQTIGLIAGAALVREEDVSAART